MIAPIREVSTCVLRVPTDQPEADGTFTWDSTTCVTVSVQAGGEVGLGWTYGSPAVATVVHEDLLPVLAGQDAVDVPARWEAMRRKLRNAGLRGIGAGAVSAVDIALWDLKGKLVGVPLARLLGRMRDQMPVYGSGGFTTYSDDTLRAQLRGWIDEGCSQVKIKIGESWGRQVDRDLHRVRVTRQTVGPDVDVFVDANGGYRPGQAARVGRALDELGVTWFEEPVSSDNVAGLAEVRREVAADVTAGEYAYSPEDVRALCPMVDCLQADVTRALGITGWLQAATIAAAYGLDVSAHGAPALHLAPAAAVPNLRHLEWFHDHVRLERLLFDGVPRLVGGQVTVPDDRPGHGFSLRADAERFAT